MRISSQNQIMVIAILFICFISLVFYGLWYKSAVLSNILDPLQIQTLFVQLPGTVKSKSNEKIALQFACTFPLYLNDLLKNKELTLDECTSIQGTIPPLLSAGIQLISPGTLDWSVFLNDYYFKNNPSLQTVEYP